MIGVLGMILKPDEARRVTLPAIRAYLTRLGWEQVASQRRGERYVSSKPVDGDLLGAVQLPASEEDGDYPLRVLDFIEFIADVYGARPLAVYAELTANAPAPAGV